MRADAVAKRQDVVEAAWRMFADQGFDVSLRSVAQEAGVGIATLYRHFPTRTDLLLGVGEELRSRVLAIVGRFDAAVDVDARQAWEAFVEELAALRFGASAAHAAQIDADGAPPELIAARQELLRSIDGVVQRAKDARLVAPDLTAIKFFIGLAVITRPLAPPSFADVPEPADWQPWLVRTYIDGLRPTSAPRKVKE